MGSSFAPSLANLFMALMEEQFILNQLNNPFWQDIQMFWHFIDDCLCIFTNRTKVYDFLEWLNNIHPSIFFTLKSNPNKTHFLDTIVYRSKNNTLAVKPYTKPTDRNNYLHFGSFHKHQLKTNIPYGQFLRLKCNSTLDQDYQLHAKRLIHSFQARGYSSGVVREAVRRANERPREILFHQKIEAPNSGKLWWALDYTPRSASIIQIFKKHWHLLKEIPGCESFPQIGLRKTNSLRSMLVRAEHNTRIRKTSSLPKGHFKCGKCKFCPLMVETKKISLPDLHFETECRSFSNRNTNFLIYLLECPCKSRYIGSTQRPLRVGIQEHVSRIKNQTKEAPIVQHYVEKQHVPNELKVSVLEVIEPIQSMDRTK